MNCLEAFSTARLRAERISTGHWSDIRAMDTDPRFMEYLGGVRDEAKSREYLTRNLKHWDDYHFGLYLLRDAQENTVVGRCALRHLDIEGTDEVELGYGLYPRYWGRGLATEVAKKLLQLGRHELRLPSLVAIAEHGNIGSQRVLMKTGLIYERDVIHEGVPFRLYRALS